MSMPQQLEKKIEKTRIKKELQEPHSQVLKACKALTFFNFHVSKAHFQEINQQSYL